MDYNYLNLLRPRSDCQTSSLTKMVYGSSAEINLNRAIESIKSAQHQHKLELETRDEKIFSLERKIELLESENYRLKEKQTNRYSEIISNYQIMEQRLTMEQTKNDELQSELAKVKQDLILYKEKIVLLESEKEKADHIIKTLLQKHQNQASKSLLSSTSQQSQHMPLNSRAGVSL